MDKSVKESLSIWFYLFSQGLFGIRNTFCIFINKQRGYTNNALKRSTTKPVYPDR